MKIKTTLAALILFGFLISVPPAPAVAEDSEFMKQLNAYTKDREKRHKKRDALEVRQQARERKRQEAFDESFNSYDSGYNYSDTNLYETRRAKESDPYYEAPTPREDRVKVQRQKEKHQLDTWGRGRQWTSEEVLQDLFEKY